MNNIPHIIPHILVRRVVNEECVLHGGSSALETIWMVKKSVQGLDKEVWPLDDRNSIRVANYIAPILVEGATSMEFDRLGVQARLSDWNMDLRFFSLQHD